MRAVSHGRTAERDQAARARHDSAELGWDVASAWNTKLLPSYVEKHFGVSISCEALRKLLHRQGLSWTRSTYTLAKGNPDEQKPFEKQMDLIKNLITKETEEAVLCTSMKCISALIMCCDPLGPRLAIKNECRYSAIMPIFRYLAP
ncbi:winged helix-turn-helix domain-containing protein [Geobacillus zalihae]|uniref:helix-turn-helix domain-containing protein n=1 Tax=Geobacillus TaxID=129337 RepID=UPI001F0D043C|nr:MULTISPECIES: winged helix-turn-helix domain-containing protein [Geobacillus]WKA47694.1 winged helix-turn-helix domain-containing protein [Geobacillus zalihae]